MIRQTRRIPTLVFVLVLAAAVASSAGAATKPGWSLAKASAYIESHVRLPNSAIVTAATYRLRYMKQIGGANGIAEAQQQLAVAKAGLGVDRAGCLGLKAVPGGYVSFRCKLAMSDELGFSAEATGTWRRLATGKWAWRSSSFTLNRGLCPEGWNHATTNGFCS